MRARGGMDVGRYRRILDRWTKVQENAMKALVFVQSYEGMLTKALRKDKSLQAKNSIMQ